MTHIWNIYEPCDPSDLGEDPYDIFVYTLRRDEAPHLGDPIYIEGRHCRIVATAHDHSRTELLASDDECYHKVCAM